MERGIGVNLGEGLYLRGGGQSAWMVRAPILETCENPELNSWGGK